MKLAVFRDLDEFFGDAHVVLASNTSSLSIGHLAAATQRPARCRDALFQSGVGAAVGRGGQYGRDRPALAAQVDELLTGTLGKTVVHVRDSAGFIVNALLIPFICSAIRQVEAGLRRPTLTSR